jgi:hypothetical protein
LLGLPETGLQIAIPAICAPWIAPQAGCRGAGADLLIGAVRAIVGVDG